MPDAICRTQWPGSRVEAPAEAPHAPRLLRSSIVTVGATVTVSVPHGMVTPASLTETTGALSRTVACFGRCEPPSRPDVASLFGCCSAHQLSARDRVAGASSGAVCVPPARCSTERPPPTESRARPSNRDSRVSPDVSLEKVRRESRQRSPRTAEDHYPWLRARPSQRDAGPWKSPAITPHRRQRIAWWRLSFVSTWTS